MADLSIVAGATSQSINVDLYVLATGAAQTGLVFNSSGLTAYYSFTGANASATAITLATLATVGTAYSSGGFIELDATHMPGVYRLDLPNAAIAASKGRESWITLTGFSGMATRTIKLELTGWDNQDGVRGGMTALPNAAASAVGGLPLSVDTSGRVDVLKINGTSQTARDIGVSVLLAAGQKVDVDTIKTNPVVNAGTVTFPTGATLASTTNITAGTITTVTTVTNQLTAAAIATGVWTDTTASDFTTALSIGKSIMNGVSLGTGLKIAECVLTDTLTTYTGNTVQTGDSFARIGTAGVGLTNLGDTRIANLDAAVSSRSTLTQTQVTGGAYSVQSASCVLGDARIAHLDADVSSRMATYTQPTGFLTATFPSGTIANTTNITAGTITTTTNLTNAPTAGDFTATMKTSLNSATPAVTVSDKTGFALTSAYDFSKGTVAMTESYAAQGAALTPAQALYGLTQQLGQQSISGTTMTVLKRDGTTTAKTYTLNDASAPTAISEAT